MATPLTLPYPPLVIVESDQAVTWRTLEPLIERRLSRGVSLCLVAASGEENHGGYFFHIIRTSDGFVFRTFDRDTVLVLATEKECVEFINHVSGRRYSQPMWEQSQLVNFRKDEDDAK